MKVWKHSEIESGRKLAYEGLLAEVKELVEQEERRRETDGGEVGD